MEWGRRDVYLLQQLDGRVGLHRDYQLGRRRNSIGYDQRFQRLVAVVVVHTYSAFGDFKVQVQVNVISGAKSATTVSTIAVATDYTRYVSAYYNQVGITSPGVSIEGQLDTAGQSYSSTALGGDAVAWGTSTFNLGPAKPVI